MVTHAKSQRGKASKFIGERDLVSALYNMWRGALRDGHRDYPLGEIVRSHCEVAKANVLPILWLPLG